MSWEVLEAAPNQDFRHHTHVFFLNILIYLICCTHMETWSEVDYRHLKKLLITELLLTTGLVWSNRLQCKSSELNVGILQILDTPVYYLVVHEHSLKGLVCRI